MDSWRILIVNADDFGEAKFTPCISEGLRRRLITSATVLVSRSRATEALSIAVQPGQSIGLHFNLTQGVPVCPPKEVPTLVNESGLFLGKERFEERLKMGLIDAVEISREFEAQVDRFSQLSGHPPSHIDGHHHVQARPEVAAVIAPLISQKAISRIRLPIEASKYFRHLEAGRYRWACHLVADAHQASIIYSSHGLRWPNFMGIGYGWHDCDLSRIEARLAELPVGVTEYMVHIARRDDIAPEDPAHARYIEWNLISSDQFRSVLHRYGIVLGSYSDV